MVDKHSTTKQAKEQNKTTKITTKPVEELSIFSPLKDAKAVYPTLLDKMQKLCGGDKVINAVLHTPCNYELYKRIPTISQLDNGEYCCVRLQILETPTSKVPFYVMQKRHIPIKIKCRTFDGIDISLVFFNIYPKMMESFFVGRQLVCQGKLKIDNNGKYSIIHPHIPTRIQQEQGAVAVYKLSQLEDGGYNLDKMQFDGIQPIYRLTEGIKQAQVISVVEKILNNPRFDFSTLDECDYLVNNILELKGQYDILPSFKEAITKLHFPQSIDDIRSKSLFRKKLSFLELLAFQVALSKARANRNVEKGNSICGDGRLRKVLLQHLPFELTNDQKKCLDEIYSDQQSEKKMLRLLQGDVGSGKTIVSLLACLNTIESGKKAVIMAPTAILAKQHFATISKYCYGLGLQAELLIGETKQKVRKDILTRLKLGHIDILVGTHTLFQKSIELPKNIGLFVIDEQHNFGVEQRVVLLQKCGGADTLMMSATPIPRTMIMALYGDIQVSRITQKPANRLPIETKVLSFEEKYDKLVEAIKRKVDANEKVYWVCPLVEESEKLDYVDVKTRFEDLSRVIDKDKIGLLHGKMKQEDKDKMMYEFKNGKYNLLVSTTVIEVGIDVPEASVIVIENAEKFGLAQLHQLRGRVGRGSKQSYCFLLYGSKISQEGKTRLDILKQSNDGFVIADADLKMRGGGAILSKEQSGFNTMMFVDFVADKDIINLLNKTNMFNIPDEKLESIMKLFNYNLENGSELVVG